MLRRIGEMILLFLHLAAGFASTVQGYFVKKNMKTIRLQPQYWAAGFLLALILLLVSFAFSVATS